MKIFAINGEQKSDLALSSIKVLSKVLMPHSNRNKSDVPLEYEGVNEMQWMANQLTFNLKSHKDPISIISASHRPVQYA